MRQRNPETVDRIRQANKNGRNRIVMTLGRAGKKGSLFALPNHTGRKSGREYTTPVRLVQKGEAFIIPLSYGERADWFRNLMAKGSMQITWQGRTYPVGSPERLERSQAEADFPFISRLLFQWEALPGFVRMEILAWKT